VVLPKAGVIIAEANNSKTKRRRCRRMEHAITPGTRAATRLREPMVDMLKSPASAKTCRTIAAEP
jgi:hypothetical protein